MTRANRTRSYDHARILYYGVGALLFALMLAFAWQSRARANHATELLPPAVNTPAPITGMQTAVLAGGCFWGTEAVFQHVEGVSDVVSGYSGGGASAAGYSAVSSGHTQHAEAVRITFDADEVSYGKLLQIYFSVAHDPTQLNRQGPDVGPQYRSNIFYANATQKKVAQAYIEQLGETGVFERPIVTRVDPLIEFYPAEAYHQNFAYRHPDNRYIVVYDLPKIRNLRLVFPDVYRDPPVIVATQQ